MKRMQFYLNTDIVKVLHPLLVEIEELWKQSPPSITLDTGRALLERAHQIQEMFHGLVEREIHWKADTTIRASAEKLPYMLQSKGQLPDYAIELVIKTLHYFLALSLLESLEVVPVGNSDVLRQLLGAIPSICLMQEVTDELLILSV